MLLSFLEMVGVQIRKRTNGKGRSFKIQVSYLRYFLGSVNRVLVEGDRVDNGTPPKEVRQ